MPLGCEDYCNHKWFHLRWAGMLQETHILVKELTPIVLATAVWGRCWVRYSVHVLLDKTSVVAAINNHTR